MVVLVRSPSVSGRTSVGVTPLVAEREAVGEGVEVVVATWGAVVTTGEADSGPSTADAEAPPALLHQDVGRGRGWPVCSSVTAAKTRPSWAGRNQRKYRPAG